MVSLIGQAFGRLIVVSRGNNHVSPCGKTSPMWNCVCECGGETKVSTSRLLSGNTKSCGCFRKEVTTARNTTHGSSKTKLYYVWKSMKDRCTRKKCKHYKDYGGRGICVCDEWLDFKVFKLWAFKNGYREGLSIDRIDNNKNYTPGNCEWISKSKQQRNRRSCIYLTHENETHTVSEWARIFGINHRSVSEYVENHGAIEAIEFYFNKYSYRLSEKVEVSE